MNQSRGLGILVATLAALGPAGATVNVTSTEPRKRPFVPTTLYPVGFKPDVKHPEKGRSLRIAMGLDSGVGSGPRRYRNGLTGKQVRKAKKRIKNAARALDALQATEVAN